MSGPNWYAEGLHFECSQCGKCCTGDPGTVLVTLSEIESLAREVELSPDEFRAVYTRELEDGALSLRERRNGACVFHDPARGCQVYASRPRQCSTYPFWGRILESRERWNGEGEQCPGINRGKCRTAEEIATMARNDGTLSSARAEAARFVKSGRPPDESR